MMYYFGVEADQALPDVTRNVEFPDGKYVVIEGSANELTGAMFGQVLNEVSDYAYVGGPNAVVVTEQGADQVSGKMIVPVVAK
ncbi:effector binding domain-containing protein [Secundilactobacillus oryzae]|nr:effector binding domain-containing protein [Secundilactobacillus oryzae]